MKFYFDVLRPDFISSHVNGIRLGLQPSWIHYLVQSDFIDKQYSALVILPPFC